jgi:hypothetical protein
VQVHLPAEESAIEELQRGNQTIDAQWSAGKSTQNHLKKIPDFVKFCKEVSGLQV